MNFRLDDRVAIVTGAGQGIGRGIALAFAEQGAAVLVATRTEQTGRETVDAIVAAGGRADLFVVDLRDRAAAVATVDTAVHRLGRLDIVVHNAAAFPMGNVVDLGDEDIDSALAVNLKNAFWFAAAAHPHLKASPAGRLLFTSSVTGPRVVAPGLAAYAASKGGLNAFIRSAALEWAADGITVNGVEPGMIRTPAVDLLDPVVAANLARYIPMKRIGEPADIAGAMVYLASDAGAYVTGQTIVVDGGEVLPENGAFMVLGGG